MEAIQFVIAWTLDQFKKYYLPREIKAAHFGTQACFFLANIFISKLKTFSFRPTSKFWMPHWRGEYRAVTLICETQIQLSFPMWQQQSYKLCSTVTKVTIK
jgi:hypothetical protein